MSNKAHTATVRRLAARFGVKPSDDGPPDIMTPEMVVEVETSATLADGVQRLRNRRGRRFIAVTNRESLPQALRLVAGTTIGVMDPQGQIVRESPAS